MGKPVRVLTNERFGRLLVIGRAGSDGHGHATWMCECDCGKLKVISGNQLTRGKTQSCGCLHDEGRTPLHGGRKTPLYNVWMQMRMRCHNPRNPAYKNYGARGIYVCERWVSFEAFRADMGEPAKGMTLDRIDNDAPYSPENCRWATRVQQIANQRKTTREGEANGMAVLTEDDVRAIRLSKLSGAALARAYGLTRTTISQIRRRDTWQHIT